MQQKTLKIDNVIDDYQKLTELFSEVLTRATVKNIDETVIDLLRHRLTTVKSVLTSMAELTAESEAVSVETTFSRSGFAMV